MNSCREHNKVAVQKQMMQLIQAGKKDDVVQPCFSRVFLSPTPEVNEGSFLRHELFLDRYGKKKNPHPQNSGFEFGKRERKKIDREKEKRARRETVGQKLVNEAKSDE